MTSSRWLTTAAIAALAIGCGTQDSTTSTGGDNTIVAPPGHHQPPPPPPATCPALGRPGTSVSSQAIDGGQIVLVDHAGDVYYTTGGGFLKQTAAGTHIYSFAYGSVLAVDAEGNAYVAGSFTQPIDLGHGKMTPIGNIDVFVAKLSARGELLFAVQLGLCGDGVESIAVAADGRIAVSGSAMGTAILDANGRLLHQLFFAGQLAFDSHGNLFVAGPFTGSIQLDSGHVLQASDAVDIDSFLAEVDVHGNLVQALQLGGLAFQEVTSIAINDKDELAIAGMFEHSIDLFGVTLRSNAVLPSGGTASSFVAKLDASGALLYANHLGDFYWWNTIGGVAIDHAGNVIVSSNIAGEAFWPYGHPTLVKLDATGAAVWGITLDNGGDGYGLGVAANACGDVYWAEANHTRVMLPLMSTLHVVAR